MNSKKLPMVLKLTPFFAAAVTALLLVVLLGRGGSDVAQAHDGHPGLNFSIGVDTGGTSADDCSTLAGTTNCTVPLSTEFRVRTYLNTLPTGVTSYEGFDVQLNYAGVDFMNRPSDATNASPDAGASPTVGGNWPNCSIEANGSNSSTVLVGCTIGIGAPASTYVGRITTADFKCPAVNGFATVTLVHGIAGSTALNQDPSTKHAEGPGAGTAGPPESLSITCGSPPTQTFTPSPTRTPTKTFTPTSTPSVTPTPTVSPTPSNTPTPTSLPSDQPDLTITKTDSPDPVAAGGIITYSLVVKNIGQQTATGVAAADILPPEVSFISANSSGATCNHDGSPTGGTVSCSITGSLAQNAQVKIVIQVTAESPVADEHITNQALVLGNNEPFFNLGNNSEYEQTVILAPRPDLVLTKTDGTDPIVSGAAELYTLTVDNTGPEPAQDVIIKDNLPAGSTYNDALSSPECDAGSGSDPDVGTVDVVCDLGTVAGQEAVQIAITGPVVTRDTVIVNLAYVSSSNELFTQTGNNLDGEFTAVIAPDPDITIDKVGPVHVKRTQYFQYTLTITNIGLGDAFNVHVSDTLPMTSINSVDQPMTLQSVSGGATCGGVVSQTFGCTITELDANGGQVVLTLNVRAPTTLVTIDLTNQASVSDPDEPGEPTGNNSDSALTQIRACYDVNGDNLMRIHDVLTEVDHYFAEPPNPLYDLLYDFDGSGKITINDILLSTQHYFDDAPCVK